MPWCEACARFYNPNSLNDDGTCPACGALVQAPASVVDRNRVPWHFWLLLAAAGGYLGWRAIQGLIALAGLV
jgi:hypothetical protein